MEKNTSLKGKRQQPAFQMFNNNLKNQRLTSLLIPTWIRRIKDLEVENETIKELKENMGRFLLIILE